MASVVVVIVLLLFLNSRSSSPGAGPAIQVPPSATNSATASVTPSPTPSPSASASPVQTPVQSPTVPAPPVSEPPATAQPVVAKVPVTVLNNSRRDGLAHEVAAELRAKGWPIAKIGNYRGRLAMTTVFYLPGQLPQARELAREFAQIRRIEPRPADLPGRGLTLVVTRDWS